MNRVADKHHILFNRQEWTLRPDAESLRETRTLMPLMDRSVHNELHKQCPPVPALGHIALYRVLREFTPGGDVFSSIDNLLLAIESANKSPKAHRLERSLGHLTMQGIALQRPFIKEGLYHG